MNLVLYNLVTKKKKKKSRLDNESKKLSFVLTVFGHDNSGGCIIVKSIHPYLHSKSKHIQMNLSIRAMELAEN